MQLLRRGCRINEGFGMEHISALIKMKGLVVNDGLQKIKMIKWNNLK